MNDLGAAVANCHVAAGAADCGRIDGGALPARARPLRYQTYRI